MDTITAIIEGRVINIQDSSSISASIQLSNNNLVYTVEANKGAFRFFHIQPGNYNVSCKAENYLDLRDTTIHLGSGRVMELTIGLAKLRL